MNEDQLIRLAFQRLGMGVGGQTITAEDAALGKTFLDAVMGELDVSAKVNFDLNDIPSPVRLGLADMVAADLGPSYAAAPPRSRTAAKMAVNSYIQPDDRTDIPDPEYY